MVAQEDVEKSKLIEKRAVSIMVPNVEYDGSFIRRKEAIKEFGEGVQGGNFEVVPKETWSSDLKVTQPIYNGQFFPARKIGQYSIKSAKRAYTYVTKETLFNVARAYYEVLKSQELVKVSQETLELAQEELRVAEVRFKVGEVTKTDVLRAKVQVERVKRDLVERKNHLKLARNVLSSVMGIGVERYYEVAEPPPGEALKEDLKELVSKAYETRDDLKANLIKINIAEEEKNVVKKKFHPSFNLEWDYYQISPETFAQQNEFWDLMFKVKIPIFEKGIRFIDLKENIHNISQARLRYQRHKKDIEVEVKDAMLQVKTYESNLATLEKEVELADENYRITSSQYKVGMATSLDLTDALTALNTVRSELSNMRYNYQLSLLNLKRVTGVFAREYVAEAEGS
jgi:outer membrane protein